MSNSPAPGLIHQIRQQCADGYALYDAGAFNDALRLFYQAWLLLPKPQIDYEAAGWVLTAIGDTYFRLAQYDQGREALTSALHCPNTGKSSFVHLRLGQCLWELGQADKAQQSLLQAYQVGEVKLFDAEDEKYFQAIASLLPQPQQTTQSHLDHED
jgi:tetratricopeptide (TPR) repeat protein